MEDKLVTPVAKINCTALRDNLARVRELAPHSRVMAVVKSNGYGHGLVTVGKALAKNVDALAVADVDEALQCRALDETVRVVVLSGLTDRAALEVCGEHHLEAVVYDREHFAWLKNYRGQALNVWLKIDTGMTRLGIAPSEVDGAVDALKKNERINTLRLMSHLANADDPQDQTTAQQLSRFTECTAAHAVHELECSLANSAGIIKWQQTHLQWVRPGIMLYGGSPLTGCTAAQLSLTPVMQLEARLLSIKTVTKGTPVGYGGEFIAPKKMRIGIVNFGYGDGYPRRFNTPPPVLIGGVRATVIGRVAMNLMTVDLSACRSATIGDRVILWGEQLSVDEIAECAGTIGYELLCKVSARVPRVAHN